MIKNNPLKKLYFIGGNASEQQSPHSLNTILRELNIKIYNTDNNPIYHSKAVNTHITEEKELILKKLFGLKFNPHKLIFLRYRMGRYYLKIIPLKLTNAQKGGINEESKCYH